MLAGKTIAGALVLFATFATLAATSRPAQAQCTTCSPLSLPSGSLVGQDLETARRSTFSLVGQATTGWVGFPNQVADNKAIETRDSARFDLFLTTMQVSALHKSGLGVDAVVPFGVLQSRTGSERRTDVSLGDAEIKPRATALIGRSLRLTGLAGAALPTGSYTAHSGPGALGDAARAVTIGRGVFWGIAEVEARVEPVRKLAFTVSTQGRIPIGEASDGFQWGPEIRSLAEAEVRPFSKAFGFAVGGELQIRGSGSQIDPFLNQRVESSNVGAKIVSVTPAIRAQLDNGLFFSVTGRIPVYQDLTGLQFKQGPGIFASAGYVFPVGGNRPTTTTTTTASAKYIVREYGAEWCEGCKKLAPLLEAQRTSRNDVRIEQIDVTQWSEGELARRVPGAKALPIVEVLRHDGSLIARLEGDRAFSFSDHLTE